MEDNQDFINQVSKCNLKEKSTKELSELSNQIRNYIIEKCSVNGGHLASNLGVVELTVALHKAFSFPIDKLLFDVGHQCYTHKILSGRSLDNLRKENGVDGFQKRKESEYDPFEAGHSSTSISSALGMALARDKNNQDYSIIAVIGDSSISNGLAFEALNSQDYLKHKIIIVINDNNMSISQPVGAFHNMLQSIRLSEKYMNFKEKYSKKMDKNRFTRAMFSFLKKTKDFFKKLILKNNYFEMFGFYYIGNVNGYDFKEMENAFKKAKKKKSSVIIHVSTIKGKGYKYSEVDNSSYYHSVKPFNIQNGLQMEVAPKEMTQICEVVSNEMDNVLSEDKDSILVLASTAFGSKMDHLLDKYQDQVLDFGISEEHAVTFCSGYALSNKKPYVCLYSTFLQRAYDQINHDVARMDLPVTFLIDRSGLVGSDGETHQGIFDESFLLNMPNMSVCMGKDQNQIISLINFSKTFAHPLAIRYPVGYLKNQDRKIEEIKYGKWLYETKVDNEKVCLITFGPKLSEIISLNLGITIVNAIFQSPLDKELLKELLSYKNIVIYDPYAIEQGFGFHVTSLLNDLGYKNQIHRICLKNEYIQKGTIEEQEKRCHVDLVTLTSLINSLKA